MNKSAVRWMVWIGVVLGTCAACSTTLFTEDPADGGDGTGDADGEVVVGDDADGGDADGDANGDADGDADGDAEADDGFEVSPTCGNGTVESGEECDDHNLTNGDGCDNTCLYSCHSPAECVDGNDCTSDLCDTGGNGRLCTNLFVVEGSACDDGNPCVVGEACNAVGACTGGTAAPPETVCRAAVDLCDAEETCGGATTCPADALEAEGYVCRHARAGALCDYEEKCTGSSVLCPADILTPDGGTCGRTSTGVCCRGICIDPGNCCSADGCRCSGRTTEACSTFENRIDCVAHLHCAWDDAMDVCYGLHYCSAYGTGIACAGAGCHDDGMLRACIANICNP
jgi:cysteine-rich repeat protein